MRAPAETEADWSGTTWAAPAAVTPVDAAIKLPGSKSMTNRALILASLAATPTTIVGPLLARDTDLMRAAIVTLGATVDVGTAIADPGIAGNTPSTAGQTGLAAWTVTPGRIGGQASVDVGNAGTVLRFVPPVAALLDADVEFTGDPRASERPVAELLDGLRQAGVTIDDGGRGAVPFVVHGRGRVAGGAVTLDASWSSQLVSGLLLAAPRFEAGLEVTHRGARVPSAPHIAMTVAMLQAAGADIETGGGQAPDFWRIRPGPLEPATIAVEPDLSNAAPFLAAALVAGGRITIERWPAGSLQAADQILAVLSQMGARWSLTDAGLRIERGGAIHGITADVRDFNETAPVLTALAALADSPSELTGIGHMRRHETDRLAALVAEIGALGGEVTELPDGLRVQPRPLQAGPRPFDSHDDHRMVMAAAVLGLAVPGLRVANAGTVAKTFPAFQAQWQQMLGHAP
jgi:3-phosphoshikimate 1-carboxyvinyltransferase